MSGAVTPDEFGAAGPAGGFRLTAPVVLPCDPSCSVLRDGALDVDADGRIVWCGPEADAPAPAPGATVYRMPGLLMPGLVNAHCHTPMIVLRGLGGDLPLMRWLTEAMWPAEARLTGDDVRTGMLLGACELLTNGVTTSVEMYFYADEVTSAILEAGSRVVLTPGIISAPGWDRLGTWQSMLNGVSRRIDRQGLISGPGDRVEVGYGPHAAYTLPTEALVATAEAARERGALLHIHLSETVGEDVALRDQHGGSVTALLDRLGVLGGRVLAAHGVHLEAADIALLARHRAAVAHCPGSNAKLAAGTAPVAALRAAAVPLALGTDGPASADDLDLWAQARLAGQLTRLATGDAAEVTAADLLLLSTRQGAAAIGRHDIGTLEPGRWADVVHLTTDDPAFIGLGPRDGSQDPGSDAALVSNLVWAGSGRLVRDVWVAGDRVLADRTPTRVDAAEALAKARTVATRLRTG
ncbi:MAG TPA: amidohydrolase family protein [Pseudonocardia sp.]|nr:amidohydrolase family protein [Pseudonocardia sp.]